MGFPDPSDVRVFYLLQEKKKKFLTLVHCQSMDFVDAVRLENLGGEVVLQRR